MIFACMSAYDGDEQETVLWAQSIRRWGGALAHAPLLVLEPEPGSLSPDIRGTLVGLAVTIVPFHLPEAAVNFPYAQKVFAAAQAEAHAAAAHAAARAADDVLVWMDSDTLVLNQPDEFRLPPGKTIACCPVQLKNISAPASGPASDFWQAVYAACATPPELIFPVTTTVDHLAVQAHFNAGLLVVRPRAGLLQSWAQNFARIFQMEQFQPYYVESPLYRIFIHQAVLAATLLTCLPADEFQLLSARYNVPIFLHQRFPIHVPDMVTCRYDEFSFFQNPDWTTGESECDAKVRGLLDNS